MFLVEMFEKKSRMPDPEHALPGRPKPIPTASKHVVSGHSIHPPFPDTMQVIHFGMGRFWGVERLFWETEGVHVTAAGYAGGYTPNPTYQEITTGMTGHAEVVMVVFDPAQVPLEALLTLFFEQHDPTQGMRQGNDIGTTYRSVIYTTSEEQRIAAEAARGAYQQALTGAGRDRITTEIAAAPAFYYAEAHHQQYLARNPGEHCALSGTGVAFPAAPS